jgi:hypothetical protein
MAIGKSMKSTVVPELTMCGGCFPLGIICGAVLPERQGAVEAVLASWRMKRG